MWKVDKKKCLRCGGCVGVCPAASLELTEHGLENSDKCTECGICARFCPAGSISIVKK